MTNTVNLLTASQPIDPVAFKIGSYPVHWYGLIIGFGGLLAYLLIQKEAKNKQIDSDSLFDTFFWMIINGFLGARVYYVVFYDLKYYLQNPAEILAIWHGGLAIYGGIIGGLITLIYFCRKNNWSILAMTDIISPNLLLAQGIGRWGNFINQEAHGGPVSRSFLENLKLPDWLVNQMYIGGEYVHPTFLYESLWNILGAVIITLVRKFAPLRLGQTTALYMLWYGIGRFFIEGMRTDSLYLGPWRVSQVVSLVIVLLGIVLWIYQNKKEAIYYKDL